MTIRWRAGPAGAARTPAVRRPSGRPCRASESFREPAEKQRLFDTISDDYDQLNDQLSLGQHRVWKRMAVAWSGARPGDSALDVCCGSGDLALLLAAAVGRTGTVVGLDFARDMLLRAEQRSATAPTSACRVRWQQGDALDLPFDAESFDAITMGYGLRNVADPITALREARRVLRPTGRAVFLDFNRSSNPVVDFAQRFLLDNVVVPAARARGFAQEYEYLKPSIARFATGPEQERAALEAGFVTARHYALGFGLMGCLVASRSSRPRPS